MKRFFRLFFMLLLLCPILFDQKTVLAETTESQVIITDGTKILTAEEIAEGYRYPSSDEVGFAPGIEKLEEAETFTIEGEDNILIGSGTDNSGVMTLGLLMNQVTVQSDSRVSTFDSVTALLDPQITVVIKYIAEDSNYGDSRGPDGNLRNRYVYCLNHTKATPTGQTLTLSAYESAAVFHVIYHGAMFYGETCRHEPHSTGVWQWDYLATHVALMVVTGQYTLAQVTNSIKNGAAAASDQNKLINAVTQMVAHATSQAVPPGFDSDGWFRMDYSDLTSFTLTKASDTWTYSDGNYYTDWISPLLTSKNGYYANSDISYFSNNITEGVRMEKKYADCLHSPYRLVVEEKIYLEWQMTGKTITSDVSIRVPSHWKIGRFVPSGGNEIYQNVGFPIYASVQQYAAYSDSVSFEIPKVEPFTLHIEKIHISKDETDQENGDPLAGAEFTLYTEETCENVVETGVTDENGILEFENLIPGMTYYLKETAAPPGYSLSNADKVYEIRGTAGESRVDLTITNEIGLLLPETGSGTMLLWIGAGILLMVCALKVKKEEMIIWRS